MPRYMGVAAAAWRARLNARQHLPDDPVAGVAILELAAGRHHVAGALAQAVGRQIGAAGIAEQHQAAARRECRAATPSTRAAIGCS